MSDGSGERRAEERKFVASAVQAAVQAALVPALRASHGGGRSSLSRRRLAPRDVLEAEFDRLARGQPVVVVDAAAAAPMLAELIDDGDLGADELRQMWGPGARDRAGFVALCEAVGDLFEDEDDEVAAPAPADAEEKGDPHAGEAVHAAAASAAEMVSETEC